MRMLRCEAELAIQVRAGAAANGDSGAAALVNQEAGSSDPDPKHAISCKGSVDTTHAGVDTMLQTQSKNKKNWSSSVDTSSSSVDTRDSVDTSSSSVDTRDRFQKTFWKTWDSVSTLDEVVSTLDQLPRTFWVKLGQCDDTRWGSVDTRELPRTLSGLFWDSVSTLPQVVSTLVALPEQNTWSERQVDTRSGQVDTRSSFKQNSFAEIGQQVDTRSGQVDTLRMKVKIVNFSVHVAAWDLGDLA
ncbi:hypothetical protein Taro_002043 [Colocasia esculenta]|uniref:Uncharacterized protein n=1 Tax=Colocasia esculenta TaxID=4460 RepID=A0A843TG64_COLES|nr:hypothetical protein [Colocasia esculenta]